MATVRTLRAALVFATLSVATTTRAEEPTSPAPPPASHRPLIRIAVTDLNVDGVDPRVGKLVTNAVVAELRKLKGTTVVGMGEVRAMLAYEADKQSLGCSERDACFTKMGEVLGVDQLVVGDIGVAGTETVFSLRRIDQAKATPLGGVTERLTPDNGEEFLGAVGPAVAKLFPELPLREGAQRGVAPELALAVNPPPLPTWATVVTGSLGGVLLAAGVVAGASALSEANAFHGLATQAKTSPVDGAVITGTAGQAQGWATAANVLYASSAVAVVGAAVMIPFTDWTGARDTHFE